MTGREIFDIAVNLMDEQNESSGETATPDTKEYEMRTVRLLNSILPRLCLLTGVPFAPLDGMGAAAPIQDALCCGVAAYDLAALLVQTDGESDLADRFRREAENNLSEIVSRMTPAESENIENVYGGDEYSEFSRWNG